MKTIYTEIADKIFDEAYNRVNDEFVIDASEDIEVMVGENYYTIPCRIRGEKTDELVNPSTYDHPDEYDDRLWLTIQIDGDVSYEDENGEPQWLPGCNLRATMVEEGYDYYEE